MKKWDGWEFTLSYAQEQEKLMKMTSELPRVW